MHLAKRLTDIFFLAGLLITVGCTGLGTPVTVKSLEQGERAIHLKAGSFEFNPNNIKIQGPGPLSLVVENIADIEHNITIKNPHGQILKSVDLPAKETTSVPLDLPTNGKYTFYCDKPFHSTFGMKGQIQVGS